jgi:hypothetical protein
VGTRAQYSEATKREVYLKYPLCLTRDDRIDLAAELGIESLAKLYNLGSRLDATRGHDIDADSVYFDPARLLIRNDPDDVVWLPQHDRYIKNAWRSLKIEQIAFRLDRSEIAISYRARQLGKRNVCYYWDAKKVMRWLGLDAKQMVTLTSRGPDKHSLEFFPCCDRDGTHKITIVSTMSLARVLRQDGFHRTLEDEYGADKFFIREVLDGTAALQLTKEFEELRERQALGEKLSADERRRLKEIPAELEPQGGETVFEANAWVSHGHTSLNPFSEVCFGWFFNGYDEKMAGHDLDPRDLAPTRDVASDRWRRGEFKVDGAS